MEYNLISLPALITWKIVQHMDPVTLNIFFNTCKKFKRIETEGPVFNEEYWFNASIQYFPGRILDLKFHPPPFKSWKHYFLGGGGQQSLKCVIVGSPGVGKSNILLRFTEDRFVDTPLSVFDNSTKIISVNGRNVMLGLWDTASLPDYVRLRPLSYPPTDIFLIVFSLVEPGSLWDVVEMWGPELRHHCPNTHIILVGAKSDLRDNSNGSHHVTTAQGTAMAINIGATTYIETSGKTGHNVELLFRQTAIAVISGYNATTKPKRCIVQ